MKTVALRIIWVCALTVSVTSLLGLDGKVALSQAPVQKETSSMTRTVTLDTRTDREKYSSGDVMEVSAYLANGGSSPVYIYRRMFWTGLGGGLELEIHDEHGKHLPSRVLSDSIMPPPVQDDTSILVRLDPGFFYGTSVNLKVGDIFPEPGRYSIRVIYKSWLRRDSVAPQLRGLPVIWENTPEIISDPVSVDVIE